MRRFSSYGPVDPDEYYYAPRNELVEKGYTQLTGENPTKGGHYFTVWAPRQCGKTWIMMEVVKKIKQAGKYHIAMISMQPAKAKKNEKKVLEIFLGKMSEVLPIKFPKISSISDIRAIFTKRYFQKPVILIIDEFDSLEEVFINSFADVFRDIFIGRLGEPDKTSGEKTHLLHGLALIGVRSVLGIENEKGSPFNIQRSLHIPNLTFEEVQGMFQWYRKESGQFIEPEVVEKLYYETNGQPGLTCWFGELLTEGFEFYSNDQTKPVTMKEFKIVYTSATYALPNNNIMNLISKAKEEANKKLILEMFQTDEKLKFKFDNKTMNALYMNGLAEAEFEDRETFYLKFACPFIQKRLFNYFSDEYFNYLGTLLDNPFTNLDDIITPTELDIIELLKFYQRYLDKNRDWLFKNAPRRSDQRIFEAIYHFSFYSYFNEFLRSKKVGVFPEFPTGNGKIDILIQYRDKKYGIELKSFRDNAAYKIALEKAAHYGKQLGLTEIFLVSFIESIDDVTRSTFEKAYNDPGSGVTVKPFFIQTGRV